MPADTDRTPPTSEPASDRPRRGVPPVPPARPVADGRPVWPVTAAVVILGWCLLAWSVFAAGINTAPFFGDTPSRDRYVESGMVLLTALPPLLLLAVLGRLLGSRWELALLGLAALVAVALGAGMIANAGDPTDPGHGRPLRAADVFEDLTRLNWLATGALLLALGLVLWRRRRRTGIRPNP